MPHGLLIRNARQIIWLLLLQIDFHFGVRVLQHGGGYQYRLCPANKPLTEECMQKMPLEFDRTEGTSLVWNNGTRLKIDNVFASEGTWPKGSTWVSLSVPPQLALLNQYRRGEALLLHCCCEVNLCGALYDRRLAIRFRG